MNNLKKYRIMIDNLFIANTNEGFTYKDETIIDLSLLLVYIFRHKKTGDELLFSKSDLEHQTIEYTSGENCSVSNFFSCHYDKQNGFVVVPNKELHAKSEYEVTCVIANCFKSHSASEIISIQKLEFVDILVNNAEYLDTTDNKPTQKPSYSTIELTHIR